MNPPDALDLRTTRLIINPEFGVTPRPVTSTFYQELDADFGDFTGHVLVSLHRLAEPWSTWERHPAGDEVVTLLSGAIEMVLWDPEHGERLISLSEPGQTVVVPRNIWHTARPLSPAEVLFYTPGQGTENVAWPPERPQ